MGFLTKLAFKNLFRYKLRTFISIIAIAFAVMIVVFARGYIVGMIDSIFADHIQYSSGHIKIIDQNYQQQERLLPLNYPVDGFGQQGLDGMIANLKAIDNVEMVIPRLKFGAMVSTENELVTMIGWGVNPDQEIAFTDIEDKLVEGRMVQPGQLEVVMGTTLLDQLNRQVGDTVTILSNTAFNSLKGVTFKIVGRLESGLKMLDEVVFYLPLDQAQRILYMEGQTTELLLVTADRNLVDQVLPKVKGLLSSKGIDKRYLALGYKETSDLLPYMEMAKLVYNQVYIFLVLLASIVVINTMIMIVKERTKEIGMMSALGLESKNILQLFVIEGSIMGIVGSFFGAMLGFILNNYLAQTGIDLSSAVAGFSSEHMVNSIIYPVSSITNTIFAFGLGVIIVTIACIIPARRAAKLSPTEAMGEG
ncbi:ABC transporter permease [Orenia metallireducens]|jgi:putative ABC transport system permease protein|uniref:ABC transporter permease n=1 Tax=Orenia metallireducens TaxID=1413210 RepID=A0A1C0A9A4_9FIRM|nr:FtsX-like permease family protein [Orenia metallireducens]OCL26853.1 ABC transporter permease [Orenia metallireducens]